MSNSPTHRAGLLFHAKTLPRPLAAVSVWTPKGGLVLLDAKRDRTLTSEGKVAEQSEVFIHRNVYFPFPSSRLLVRSCPSSSRFALTRLSFWPINTSEWGDLRGRGRAPESSSPSSTRLLAFIAFELGGARCAYFSFALVIPLIFVV